MDILKGLNDAARYLEANLCGPVDLEKAARLAGISEDSFARFFSYISGMTAAEYLRRRRLTLAAYELRESEIKVIDAAMKYGFQSADTFARAFARQHGFPPSCARRSSWPLKVYPPISFHILVKGAKEMDFRLVNVSGLALRGIPQEFECEAGERFGQERAMWSPDQDRIMERVCKEGPGVWYGIWDCGRYWVAKPEPEALQDGTETVRVPAGTYAAFTSGRGGLAGEELRRLRELVFDCWLPDSGYRQAGGLEMEVYHLYALHPREEKRKRFYELWIPVEKRPVP